MEFWQNWYKSRDIIPIFQAISRKENIAARFLCPERPRSSRLCKWMRLSWRCTVLPNHSPHCIYTTSPRRVAHTAKLWRQQPFRTKFMMSEKEKYVQKSGEIFYILISSFEWISPENNRVWGRFLHFLTQQIFWRMESRLQVAATLPLTYLRELGNHFFSSMIPSAFPTTCNSPNQEPSGQLEQWSLTGPRRPRFGFGNPNKKFVARFIFIFTSIFKLSQSYPLRIE